MQSQETNEIYCEICAETQWLHGRWLIYKQLFRKSQKRIYLLNECAPSCFNIIQYVIIENIQISLSKLSDPGKVGKRENLSLETLHARIELEESPDLAKSLKVILKRFHDQCAPFRTWRNKRFAHFDLGASLNVSGESLPEVSIIMIEGALATLREYLNYIEGYFRNTEIGYDHILFRTSDADTLVSVLKAGMRYEELVQENALPFDDRSKSPWHDA